MLVICMKRLICPRDSGSSATKSVACVKGQLDMWGNLLLHCKKFKECVDIENIESKSLLCLDICTKWNSIYLMLDSAQKIERAFERFEE